jgi:hypothetical protein
MWRWGVAFGSPKDGSLAMARLMLVRKTEYSPCTRIYHEYRVQY